jgi:hypothetical protein
MDTPVITQCDEFSLYFLSLDAKTQRLFVRAFVGVAERLLAKRALKGRIINGQLIHRAPLPAIFSQHHATHLPQVRQG